jgi:hypothetical protein
MFDSAGFREASREKNRDWSGSKRNKGEGELAIRTKQKECQKKVCTCERKRSERRGETMEWRRDCEKRKREVSARGIGCEVRTKTISKRERAGKEGYGA